MAEIDWGLITRDSSQILRLIRVKGQIRAKAGRTSRAPEKRICDGLRAIAYDLLMGFCVAGEAGEKCGARQWRA